MNAGTSAQLPEEAHTSRPWRIHEIAADFRVEDVWALPAFGEAGDFRRLVEQFASAAPDEGASGVAGAIWALRWKLGDWFRWDEPPEPGSDGAVGTLLDRLPDDLRGTSADLASDASLFEPLYLLDDEFAAEIVNRTMHGVLHLGWVPDGTGRYRGQMGILVKPNGAFGRAYMTAIRPFRHLIIYPALLKRIEAEANQ